jgi:hypothetical protein
MKIRANSSILLGLGLAVSALFGAVIGVGQLGRVRVPQDSEWAHRAPVCPDEIVDAAAYVEAVVLLEQRGLPIAPLDEPCDGRAAIHVRVSPTDVDRLYPSTEAMGDHGQITGSTARGAFERRVVSGVIADCTVYLRSGTDTTALVHELVHCLGYDHPRNPPAGHVMSLHYDRITLDDWRGLP